MNNEYFHTENGDIPGRIRLVGELDLASVLAFRAAVEKAPVDGELTLDLASLTYIDSSGLHAIVECAQVRNGGGPVRIVNAGEHVLRVLQIVGLDQDPRIVVDAGGK